MAVGVTAVPALRSSAIAVEPSPSSAMVMAFGCSWANGVSGGGVVTPSSSGYSKLIEWAMISWPCSETRKARNFCAAAWCFEDFRIAGARDVEHVAGVVRGEVGDLRVDVARPELGLHPVPVVLVDHAEGHRAAVDLVGDGLVVGVDVARRRWP